MKTRLARAVEILNKRSADNYHYEVAGAAELYVMVFDDNGKYVDDIPANAAFDMAVDLICESRISFGRDV